MVLWIIATLAAFFVKGLCGFANTLVFTSILGFGENNVAISPVELMLGYPSNLILTWKNRKSLKKEVFIPLAVLVLFGSIPGALLLKNVDVKSIKIVFGVVVILLALEMFLREKSTNKYKESRLVLAIIGIVSGVLCGLFGVGALLAAYIGRTTDNSKEFKGNISAVFIADNTFRILLYKALGLLTLDTIKSVIFLIPYALLGLFTGIKCCGHMDKKTVRRLTTALLILSGISLVLKNL